MCRLYHLSPVRILSTASCACTPPALILHRRSRKGGNNISTFICTTRVGAYASTNHHGCYQPAVQITIAATRSARFVLICSGMHLVRAARASKSNTLNERSVATLRMKYVRRTSRNTFGKERFCSYQQLPEELLRPLSVRSPQVSLIELTINF